MSNKRSSYGAAFLGAAVFFSCILPPVLLLLFDGRIGVDRFPTRPSVPLCSPRSAAAPRKRLGREPFVDQSGNDACVEAERCE